MKKLLYISVNSKPEELSASKTVARKFIDSFLLENKEFTVDEIDLYETHIPRLDYHYFEKRNCVISEEDAKSLAEKERAEIQKIRDLVEQFISANVYVIAAPMWSLSFPAPLKEYMDCIVQQDKTIRISQDKIEGLLNDKPRTLIYIQASGGEIPWLLKPVMNKGVNYIESLFKVMGVKTVKDLLVDGTGFTDKEREEAIEKACNNIQEVIEDMKF